MLISRLRQQPKHRLLLGLLSLLVILNLVLLFRETRSIASDSITYTTVEITARDNYAVNGDKKVEETVLKEEDEAIIEIQKLKLHTKKLEDNNEIQIVNDLDNKVQKDDFDNKSMDEEEQPSCELWVNFPKQIVEISPKTDVKECSLYLVVDPNNRKLSTPGKYSILKVIPSLNAILADLKVYSLLSTFIYSNIYDYPLFVFASFETNEQKNTPLAQINSLKKGIEYFFLNSTTAKQTNKTTKRSDHVLILGSNTFMKIENTFGIEYLNQNDLFNIHIQDNFSPNAFLIHQYTDFVKDFFSNLEPKLIMLQKQSSHPQAITFDDLFRIQVLDTLGFNTTNCFSRFCGWSQNKTYSSSANKLFLMRRPKKAYYLIMHYKDNGSPNHLVYEINEESPFTVYPHPPYFAQLMNFLNKYKDDENILQTNDKRYLGLKCEIQVDFATFEVEVIRESMEDCAIYRVIDISNCVSPMPSRVKMKSEFALLRAGSSIDFVVKSKFKNGLISSLYYAQSYGYRLFYYDASKDFTRDDIWLKSHIPKEKGVEALFSLFDYENSSEKAVYYMDVDGLMTDVVDESFSIETVVKMSKLNENHQFDLLLQDEHHICAGVFLIWNTQFGRSFFPSIREACERIFPYCLPHPWEQNMFQKKIVTLMNGTNNFIMKKDAFFFPKRTEAGKKWQAWSTYFQTFVSKSNHDVYRRDNLTLLSKQIWPHVAFTSGVPQLHTCLWFGCATQKQGLFYHSSGAYFEQRTRENKWTVKTYETLNEEKVRCENKKKIFQKINVD